ncbi:hypothetical protein ACFYXV_29125 [Streptomyces sp. NPDC002181]|uniref:hypothetical protein n=1 Tax=Streptomyces sp. NPDC002181 TaxID=3364635 RepID=UPI0036C27386
MTSVEEQARRQWWDGPASVQQSGRRSLPELLGELLAASALIPFFQAVVTKAGEETYAKIRNLLSPAQRARIEDDTRPESVITIIDPDSRVIVRLPESMELRDLQEIGNLRLRWPWAGWLLVTHDGSGWRISHTDVPPEDGITLAGGE